MISLAWLIPAAFIIGLIGLCGFFWSVKTGQFDDLEGDAFRILNDEDKPLPR